MNLFKAIRRQTPEDKATQHLYQTRMDLLDAQMALSHYTALVASLQSSVRRLEQHLKASDENISEYPALLDALWSDKPGGRAHAMDN
jgi:hypothetical protein